MSVRARLYVSQVARNAGDTATVTLQAVSRGKENSEWSKYTPSATFTMTLTREASGAFAYFNDRVGKEVFADFSDAADPLCTQCGEPVERNAGGEIRGTDGYLPGEYVHTHCTEAAKVRLGIV
jgi:hypothetical protein